MLKNIIYVSASVLLFFAGLICYGVILNLREVSLDDTLKEMGIDSPENVKLVIDRKNYKIELYSDKMLIKSYKAVFGKNSGSVKKSSNDLVTPVGDYKICGFDISDKYHMFFQLNYPNEKDAAESLKRGYINETEFDAIVLAQSKNECPPKNTRLGANIGIHGIGEYDIIFRNLPFVFNWTNGSIAVSNENIDELSRVVKVGTQVKITY